MLMDRTIITRHAGYAVQAQRCEVMWRDGSRVVLHPVQPETAALPPGTCLRALQTPDGGWFVVDVATLAPELRDDLRQLPVRDHQGAVFYTLRLRWRTAAEFMRRAAEQFVVCWHGAPGQEAA